MACKYCVEAHTDLRETDCDPLPVVKGKIKSDLLTFIFEAEIDPGGFLVLYTYWSGGYFPIGKRKIKYCPFCGDPIPLITPTEAHEKGGA